jgi:hypothetical protein
MSTSPARLVLGSYARDFVRILCEGMMLREVTMPGLLLHEGMMLHEGGCCARG